jgi:hypothetical protein
MPKFQVGDLVVKADDGARGKVTAIDPENALCRVRWSETGALRLGSEDALRAAPE